MTARGGKREGAGRPAGAKSRATKKHKKTLTDIAREHTGDALKVLVDIAKDEDMPPAARVSRRSA